MTYRIVSGRWNCPCVIVTQPDGMRSCGLQAHFKGAFEPARRGDEHDFLRALPTVQQNNSITMSSVGGDKCKKGTLLRDGRGLFSGRGLIVRE